MWKKFQFFDRSAVYDGAEGPGGEGKSFIQGLNVTCCTSGRSKLIVGDAEGSIHVLDRNFKPFSWQAFEHRVTVLHQMKSKNILVGVGNDKEDMDDTSIKLFNMDKIENEGMEGETPSPAVMRTIKIQPTEHLKKMVPMTCLAIQEDLSQLAVGLCNGAVVQIFGDLYREKNLRQRVILKSTPGVMVTGLGFPSGEEKKDGTKELGGESTPVFLLPLFCVTSANCLVFVPTDKEREQEKPYTLDAERGADLNCVAFSDDMEVVLADEQGVFFYSQDGPGACYGFEGMHAGSGRRKFLMWFRGYLVVVSALEGMGTKDSLMIYDLSNRYIAFSSTFERITHLVAEWGYIYIFTVDRQVHRLDEKDIQTKMETLFKKNHYETAIKLALRSNYDVIEIYREYGNHLYAKKDFSGAMEQYIKTIGSANSINRLEPSYVIRRFLDAQRIGNLTSYLQKLHTAEMANSDHTTLLLNCYTKLNDVSRLNEFVRDESLSFEKETAIKVCKQAGFHEHALYLAKKHNEHNWYLRILLEDLQKHTEALSYMYTLDFFDCEQNVKKYGKTLITELPQQTTQLLMELCTKYKQRSSPTSSASTSSPATSSARSRLSTSPSSLPSASPLGGEDGLGVGALKELIMDKVGVEQPLSQPPPHEELHLPAFDDSPPLSSFPAQVKSDPEHFIHIYVDEPDWLIVFLEFMIEVGSSSEVVADTLFELYLSASDKCIPSPAPLRALPPSSPSLSASQSSVSILPPPEKGGPIEKALEKVKERGFESWEEKERRKEKALALLKNSAVKCDSDHLLMLCKNYDFQEGLLFLYEKMHLYTEIVHFYQKRKEYASVVKACKRYGEAEPQLWRSALTYFADQDPTECRAELMEVLANIDKRNLMPPLSVINTLAKQEKITLELVQDYINRHLHQQNQWIKEDEKQIKEYTEETEKMQQEIHELKTSARVFQPHKCSTCSVPLDLPAVHFLCKHSYHLHCLNDYDECPKCSANNRQVMEIKKSLDDQVAQHDNFAKQLESSADGFSTVAEYFGRGLFRPDTKKK